MIMAKNALEIKHITEFVDLKFGLGLQIDFDGESPDAVLYIGLQKIGIEHTQIHQPPTPDGLYVKQQESIRNQIVRKSKIEFEKKLNVILRVRFQFNDYYWLNHHTKSKIKTRDINDFSKVIGELISNHIPNIGESIHLQRPEIANLPLWLRYVEIFRPNDVSSSCWNRHNGGIVPYVTTHGIQLCLNKKNNSLIHHSCIFDKNYLLLVSDHIHFEDSASLDLLIDSYQYQSDFSEVYILSIHPVDPPKLQRLLINPLTH